jgi:hypothetical protein
VRKMSFRVVCIALMALFVMGISLSCVDNEVIEPLGQGLYFDGFFGPFIVSVNSPPIVPLLEVF